MPTFLLSTVDEVRALLGLGDNDVINEACAAALAMATHHLAARLRTPFDYRADYADTFYVRRSRLEGPVAGVRRYGIAEATPRGAIAHTRFLLARGFVTSLDAAVAASTSNFAGDTVNLLTATDDGGGGLLVDNTRGIVEMTGFDVSGMYVRLTYAAGLQDQVSLTDVPTWLQRAAVATAAMLALRSPTLSDQASPSLSQDAFAQSIAELCQPYIRYAPIAETPFITA